MSCTSTPRRVSSFLGIDSKLRGCDLVALRVRDICHGDQVAARAVVMQHKTQRPVQFEITLATRELVQKWIKQAGLKAEDFEEHRGHPGALVAERAHVVSRVAVFVEVVEHGSFSKAAAGLGLGKSIVSAHVAALEKRIGTQLLTRSTRALALTQEGRVFYENCRRMVSAGEEAFATVESHRASVSGTIRLTSSYNVGVSFLIKQLARFRQAHPDVTFDLVLEDSVSEAHDRPISAVFPSRDRLPTRVRLLIDFLRESLSTSPPVESNDGGKRRSTA